MIKKVIKQSSNYFWGEAAVMGASLISFPILTRILTKQQYGLMALLGVTTALIGGVSSLGLNRSIVRFYHPFRKSGKLTIFVGTLFTSTLAMQVLGLIISIGIAWFLLFEELISFKFFSLLPIALGVVILQNIFKLLNTLHRMDEEIFKYNAFSIIRQYSAMCASICFVLIYRNLYSFYSAQLVAQIVVVAFVVLQCYKKVGPFFRKAISKPIIKESLKYGFPLALSAICSIVFNLGDRYVIACFLDAEHVASYSVAFNLCNYFKQIVITSINLSLIPLTYKLWEQKKIEEIKSTLSSILKYYFMGVMPALCIFLLIPKELITVIASTKYIDAANVLPILMAGVIIGFTFPFSAGLHLKKKTSGIMITIASMSAVNIALNCILVPIFGIQGAAYSTLICGLALVFCFFFLSRKFLPLRVPFQDIGKYAIISGLTYGLILLWSLVSFDSTIPRPFAVSFLFIFLYAVLLVIFDVNVRLGLKRIKPFLFPS